MSELLFVGVFNLVCNDLADFCGSTCVDASYVLEVSLAAGVSYALEVNCIKLALELCSIPPFWMP